MFLPLSNAATGFFETAKLQKKLMVLKGVPGLWLIHRTPAR
jgi:hypothetical protein